MLMNIIKKVVICAQKNTEGVYYFEYRSLRNEISRFTGYLILYMYIAISNYRVYEKSKHQSKTTKVLCEWKIVSTN